MEEEHHNEHKEEEQNFEHKVEIQNVEHKVEPIHHAHHEHHEKKEHVKKEHVKLKKSALWMAVSVVLAVLLVISIYTGGFGKGSDAPADSNILSSQEAADKVVDYINTNLMQPGVIATFNSVEDSGDLYIIKLDIGGNEFESYVTKDGKLLIPDGRAVIDMDQKIELPTQAETPQAEQQVEIPSSEVITDEDVELEGAESTVEEETTEGELPVVQELPEGEDIVEEQVTGGELPLANGSDEGQPTEEPVEEPLE